MERLRSLEAGHALSALRGHGHLQASVSRAPREATQRLAAGHAPVTRDSQERRLQGAKTANGAPATRSNLCEESVRVNRVPLD